MEKMRVAINGFGRIGRLYLRAIFEANLQDDVQVVAVNDLQCVESAIHLLKHDSVHGLFNANIEKISDTEFSVNGHKIAYASDRDPEKLPWKNYEIDVVVECTGAFRTHDASYKHITAGAKKVLISCPSKDADKTIVFGVNNNTLTSQDLIVSNASCTTNCLAPVVKVLQENFGIINGHLLTVHSYTGDQRIVDLSHKDRRRARAGGINMIPTSTGATSAIEKIFPALAGKLCGMALRVPTPNVSMIDFTFTTDKTFSVDELKTLIKQYSQNELKGVLGYSEEELVSSDFNHSSYSSVVDMPLVSIIGDHIGHVVAWYDNEWGFSNRMIDVTKLMYSVS